MSNYCTVQTQISLMWACDCVGAQWEETMVDLIMNPLIDAMYGTLASCHRTGPLNRTSFLPPAPETVLYECHWMTPHWTIHILLILNVETSFSLLYSNHYIENYKLYDYWIWESNWQVADNNNNVISSHFIHRTILQTGLKIEGKFKGVSFLDWHMLNGCQVCSWSIQ